MGQLRFFNLSRRYECLDANNDPLVAIRRYREALAKVGAVEELFDSFDAYCRLNRR
jgi:hypothetical protein